MVIFVRSGRRCDGYDPELLEVSFEEPITESSLLFAPNTQISKNDKELRSFQYYRERTVSQLTSFFPDELWSKLLLQYAESEPCIRHALFAFSNFHENFMLRQMSQANSTLEEPPFALAQYNFAIQKLVQPSSLSSSPLINLVSCIVFIAIEVRAKTL